MKFFVKRKRRVKRINFFPSPGAFPVEIYGFRARNREYYSLEMHPEVEIQFIQAGVGAYIIGRRIYSFKRRMALIIKPNQPHRFLPDSRVVIEKVYVAFRMSLLRDLWCRRIVGELPVTMNLTEQENTLVDTSLRMIRSELENKNTRWQVIIVNELIKLMVLLKRISERKEPCLVPDKRVLKAMDYIDANFAQAITVEDLAKAVAVSASHLAHRFKLQTGMGIRHYLLQRRIAEAKTIMETLPGIKLTALALQLGFCDFALFNRAFRRLTGMAPSDWRRISHL